METDSNHLFEETTDTLANFEVNFGHGEDIPDSLRAFDD